MNFFGKIKSLFGNWKDKDVIYDSYSWGGFGSSVAIKEIYTTKQDNELLIQYFNNVAEVAAPILKYVDGAAQVKIKSNIPEVEKLFQNPNYYQNGSEFLSSLVLHSRLFGEAIINIFSQVTTDSTKKPKYLYLLTPQAVLIKTTKEDDFRLKEIENYLFLKNTQDYIKIDPSNILHFKESHPNFKDEQYLFGVSRLAGAAKSIQSVIAGYGAKVNLYSNGPRLIITGKNQGDFASVNETEEIEAVQERMKKYGWSKDKYNNLVTDKPLDVTNASLNVRQLSLNENNIADFQRICDVQNIDSKCFSETSTFTNKEAALSEFYNNAFRSEIDSKVKGLENKLKEWWPNLELTVDYSQISEIVAEQQKENERIFEDVKVGLMTRNEYLDKTGQEKKTEPEFDQLYILNSSNEWIPVNQTNQNEN